MIGESAGPMKEVMHVDEFIFNYCVSSMISDDIPESSTESAMNVFSIDENKIRDANGIIFAEAITCYKCTFCGKMFAAMEVVLTHYQSNHRCSVIPLLKGMSKLSPIKPKPGPKQKSSKNLKEPFGPIPKARHNVLAESTNETPPLLRDSTKSVKSLYNNPNLKKFKCHYPGCPKSFSYRIGLETHQKSHKKLKSYKCDWSDCKFKCSDLAGLRFHKNTHSGENPFKCVWPGCSQSFPDRFTKDEHLQKEHIKDKLLECDYSDCSAKFVTASERDRHINAIHVMRKTRNNSGPNTPKMGSLRSVSYVSGGKRGRPPKKKIIVENNTSSDESESSDEDNENNADDNRRVDINIQLKEDSKNEQPLDLSKTALNLSTDSIAIDLTTNSSKEQKPDNKTPGKRGRKRKKSRDKTIQKTVYRCDYPGCRKTFSDADELHEHEKEAHRTALADGRSRYERRCKGNLYYKL